jgi:hypothetical protein
MLDLPTADSRGFLVAVLADKSPLVVRLSIRNRLGVPQTLPTQFVVKSNDGKPAIRPGMSITLSRLREGEEGWPCNPQYVNAKRLPTPDLTLSWLPAC